MSIKFDERLGRTGVTIELKRRRLRMLIRSMYLIAVGFAPLQVAAQTPRQADAAPDDPAQLLSLTITGRHVRIPRGYLLSSQGGKHRHLERVKDGDVLVGFSFELCWPGLRHARIEAGAVPRCESGEHILVRLFRYSEWPGPGERPAVEIAQRRSRAIDAGDAIPIEHQKTYDQISQRTKIEWLCSMMMLKGTNLPHLSLRGTTPLWRFADTRAASP